MVEEDFSVPVIAEKCSAQLPHLGRGLDPAGGFGIELAQLLQLTELVFRQDLDPHICSHSHCTIFRFVLLPGIQGFVVITHTSPSSGALRRTVHEDQLICSLIVPSHIRFSAGPLHFIE
ncbi:hypothetical protein D3C81_1630710 [compost metagenome]